MTHSRIRQTHTFATLEASAAAYDEIAAKMRAVDYHHAFVDGAIDMHGIGLVRGRVDVGDQQIARSPTSGVRTVAVTDPSTAAVTTGFFCTDGAHVFLAANATCQCGAMQLEWATNWQQIATDAARQMATKTARVLDLEHDQAELTAMCAEIIDHIASSPRVSIGGMNNTYVAQIGTATVERWKARLVIWSGIKESGASNGR